jgi:glycosyltransferase involved in cell wall biosynthesis
LIDAMPEIRARRPVTCLIVGEFYESREPYDDHVRRLGLGGDAVRFVDHYVPDGEVGVYFAAADVVVLPYTSATQSGVVQVAYGFGRPVITTAVGGLPEVVRDGVTGLLIPPNDPRALAGAVERFYAMGDADRWTEAVASERSRYSWDPLVRAIESVADPA